MKTIYFIIGIIAGMLLNVPELKADWYTSAGTTVNIAPSTKIANPGQITVNDSSAFTIKEGVSFTFHGHHKLIVEGALYAIGTESMPVIFTAGDTITGWHGIRFASTNDSSALKHCIIEYGIATGSGGDKYGGGIFGLDIDNLLVENCEIRNNTAQINGGGIYLKDCSNIKIENCNVFNNNTDKEGGGIYLTSTEAYILQTKIVSNTSNTSGGGIRIGNCNPILENVTIRDNNSGGLRIRNASPSIINTSIINNNSDGSGAGIDVDGGSSPTLMNVLIAGNTSTFGNGGGIYCDLYTDSELQLHNVTLSNNSAIDAGGIYMDASGLCTINSSIIYNNTPNEITGNPVVNYSDVKGGWVGGGSNNMDFDPMFTGSGMHPYDLDLNSPCINKGDPAASGLPYYDLDGRIRIANDTVDMGAYEPSLLRELDLTLFLEGCYQPDLDIMSNELNSMGMLPLNHPFNPALPYCGNQNPEWLYNGPETVVSLSSNVIDWVLIELRDASDAGSATKASAFTQQAALLLDNGNVVGLDGMNLPVFSNTASQQIFAVVYHRNHLGIMSSSPLTETGGSYSYNFSDNESKIYGGILGHKELETGLWGMTAGDATADGQINSLDKLDAWALQVGTAGYMPADFNLNGQVENVDKIDFWFFNSGKSSQVPQ